MRTRQVSSLFSRVSTWAWPQLTTLTAAGRQQATSAQEELVGQAWI